MVPGETPKWMEECLYDGRICMMDPRTGECTTFKKEVHVEEVYERFMKINCDENIEETKKHTIITRPTIWHTKIHKHLMYNRIHKNPNAEFEFLGESPVYVFFLEKLGTESLVIKIDLITGEQYQLDYKLNQWMYSGGSFES